MTTTGPNHLIKRAAQNDLIKPTSLGRSVGKIELATADVFSRVPHPNCPLMLSAWAACVANRSAPIGPTLLELPIRLAHGVVGGGDLCFGSAF